MNVGAFAAIRTLPLLLLTACTGNVPAAELPRAGDACDQIPEPHRWIGAGIPDVGTRPPLLSAHRGGVTLAPENKLAEAIASIAACKPRLEPLRHHRS